MYEEVFEKALASLIVAADYQEYTETGKSHFLDYLEEQGFTPKAAQAIVNDIGSTETRMIQAYLNAFEAFEAEEEFDAWSQEEGRFEKAKAEIIHALSLMDPFTFDPFAVDGVREFAL